MEYFTISELIYSDAAVARRIWNGASREVEANLVALVEAVLDPLREMYGKPITVNSGYRNAKVNRLVGGAAGSQHLTGEAADITVGGREGNRELARLIVKMGLPFDQLIDENDYSWVHVSHRKDSNRNQILRIVGKRTRRITPDEL